MHLATLFWFFAAVVAAFVAGWLEGPRFWVWLKSWFHKEEQAVVAKVEHTVGLTGPSGS